MSSDNPNEGVNPYKIEFTRSDLINAYIKEWVLRWCKENHPEAFEEALKLAKESLDCSKKESKDS